MIGLTLTGLRNLLHADMRVPFDGLNTEAKAIALERAEPRINARDTKWVADNLTSKWGAQKFLQSAGSEATLRGQAAERAARKEFDALPYKEQEARTQGDERAEAMKRARLEEEGIFERAMASTDTVAVELSSRITPPAIRMGPGLTFRAVGMNQPPWTLKGFTSLKAPVSVADLVRTLYGNAPGATDYLGDYRASTANNPRDYPFISTGPIVNDAQGASSGRWQYAIGDARLREVPPDAIARELSITLVRPTMLTNVHLFTDSGDLGQAKTAYITHGTLPETTWITPVPSDLVKAFIHLGGQPWMRRWTSMSDAEAFRSICATHGFLFD